MVDLARDAVDIVWLQSDVPIGKWRETYDTTTNKQTNNNNNNNKQTNKQQQQQQQQQQQKINKNKQNKSGSALAWALATTKRRKPRAHIRQHLRPRIKSRIDERQTVHPKICFRQKVDDVGANEIAACVCGTTRRRRTATTDTRHLRWLSVGRHATKRCTAHVANAKDEKQDHFLYFFFVFKNHFL